MERLVEDAVSTEKKINISRKFFSKGRIDLDCFLKVIKILDSEDTDKIIFLMTRKNEEVPNVIKTINSDYLTKYRHIVNQEEWEEKVLESLIIIKNYDVIRMMGYSISDIEDMKRTFFCDAQAVHNVSVYINRIMKSLYFLSENLKLDETIKLVAKVNIASELINKNLELEIYILHWIKEKLISINSGTVYIFCYLKLIELYVLFQKIIFFLDNYDLHKLLKVLKPLFSGDLAFNFLDYWEKDSQTQDSRSLDSNQMIPASNMTRNNDSTNSMNEYRNNLSVCSNNLDDINVNHLWDKPHDKHCIIINIINFNGDKVQVPTLII